MGSRNSRRCKSMSANRMKRTRANYMIALHQKSDNTKPEIFYRERVLKQLPFSFQDHPKIPIADGETWYDFTPDYFIQEPKSEGIFIEIQGYYHYHSKKQRQKTNWRNEAIIDNGYRVLLIHWQLCKVKYHDYLREQTVSFLGSSDKIKELSA